MKQHQHYNVNFDADRCTRVRVVPHQEYPDKMPTYEIVLHRTGLVLKSGLSLVEVKREMGANGYELVVPE